MFDAPGESTIQFRLLWNPNKRLTASANVRVTALGWEVREDKKQLEALNLWKDQHIAGAFQDEVELSDSSLRRLRKLAEEYPETVYGRWALELLDKTKKPSCHTLGTDFPYMLVVITRVAFSHGLRTRHVAC